MQSDAVPRFTSLLALIHVFRHANFSQSTDEKKALTTEEKAAQFAMLQVGAPVCCDCAL